MDSQERHELKQNELAEALGNFGEFWKRFGNAIMIFITIVVVVIAVFRLYSNFQQTQFENSWADLAEAPSPFAKADVAETAAFPMTRAMAHLHAADLYLQESLAPAAAGDALAASPEQSLDKAAEHYRSVLEENVDGVVHLNAKLGLAVVAQGKGNLDEAAAGFKEVVELAGDLYPAHAAAAEAHLALRARLEKPIPLAADPPPSSLIPPAPPLPGEGDDAAGPADDESVETEPAADEPNADDSAAEPASETDAEPEATPPPAKASDAPAE